MDSCLPTVANDIDTAEPIPAASLVDGSIRSISLPDRQRKDRIAVPRTRQEIGRRQNIRADRKTRPPTGQFSRRLATRAPRRGSGCVSFKFEAAKKDRPPSVRCPQSWHEERPMTHNEERSTTDDASTKNEAPRTKNSSPPPDAATASPWLLVAAYGDGPLVGSRQGHRGVIRDAVRIGSRRWERINRRSLGARSRGTGNDHR